MKEDNGEKVGKASKRALTQAATVSLNALYEAPQKKDKDQRRSAFRKITARPVPANERMALEKCETKNEEFMSKSQKESSKVTKDWPTFLKRRVAGLNFDGTTKRQVDAMTKDSLGFKSYGEDLEAALKPKKCAKTMTSACLIWEKEIPTTQKEILGGLGSFLNQYAPPMVSRFNQLGRIRLERRERQLCKEELPETEVQRILENEASMLATAREIIRTWQETISYKCCPSAKFPVRRPHSGV